MGTEVVNSDARLTSQQSSSRNPSHVNTGDTGFDVVTAFGVMRRSDPRVVVAFRIRFEGGLQLSVPPVSPILSANGGALFIREFE